MVHFWTQSRILYLFSLTSSSHSCYSQTWLCQRQQLYHQHGPVLCSWWLTTSVILQAKQWEIGEKVSMRNQSLSYSSLDCSSSTPFQWWSKVLHRKITFWTTISSLTSTSSSSLSQTVSSSVFFFLYSDGSFILAYEKAFDEYKKYAGVLGGIVLQMGIVFGTFLAIPMKKIVNPDIEAWHLQIWFLYIVVFDYKYTIF